MRKVFVSGCYDVLHAGHAQFFADARALGDHLTVSVATDEVLLRYKGRRASLPFDNKVALIKAIRYVDHVVPSTNADPIFDFRDSILREQAHLLVVTEDDQHQDAKRAFCRTHGIEFVVLAKRNSVTAVSTTNILATIRDEIRLPLRVDFAGGWLDVPRFARAEAFVVNCTIEPLVALDDWPYEIGGGLGGSAARALLQIKNGLKAELDAGVGWQDPAVIEETGMCVWRSGATPVLQTKVNPDWLRGRMLLYWTGSAHSSPDLVDLPRDYEAIVEAGHLARRAAERRDLEMLASAVHRSYAAQLAESMKPLPDLGGIAKKYLGGGHGGYALYLFADAEARQSAPNAQTKAIEPYMTNA
jgi:cytidyltransferase-like protein